MVWEQFDGLGANVDDFWSKAASPWRLGGDAFRNFLCATSSDRLFGKVRKTYENIWKTDKTWVSDRPFRPKLRTTSDVCGAPLPEKTMLVSGQNGRPLPEKRGTPNRLRIRHPNRASKTDPKRMPDFELRFWLIFSVEIGTPFRPQIGHPKRITKLSAPNRPQCCDVRTDPENVENWTGTRRQRFWGAIFGGTSRESRQPKTLCFCFDSYRCQLP